MLIKKFLEDLFKQG